MEHNKDLIYNTAIYGDKSFGLITLCNDRQCSDQFYKSWEFEHSTNRVNYNKNNCPDKV